MRTPKVSVLMPVYNTDEKYLREAIESILNQTFKDFELVICNDGSTNNAVQVIQSYSDKRIRFVQNEKNLGLCATRNKLMQLAKGEYVAWADSDDISVATRLEKQVDYLDAHPDVSVVSALYERFPNHFVPDHPEHVGMADLLRGCVIAQPVTMYRHQDFKNKNLIYSHQKEYDGCEDFELWVRVVESGLKVVNLQEVLLKYRWHPDNISHKRSEEINQKVEEIHKKILRMLSGDNRVRHKLDQLFTPAKDASSRMFYLFGIRFFKIKKKGNKTKWYLFGIIPVLKTKGQK